MSELAIVGAGAWGTALALHAARAGHHVSLWAHTPFAGRISPRLPNHPLPASIDLTPNLPTTADAILLAVPTQHLRATLALMTPRAPLLLCCKGLEAGTHLLPLEIAAALHPTTPAAILSGPNFAAEIAAGLPAASVIAAPNAALRATLIALLATPTFRLYGNADAIGVQLGGAAKNVIAIAAGAITGAGIGENARAALITRGLAELSRLITAHGGRAETAAGLSGLGDLLLTCTGPSSRNFAYGLSLAHGASPPGPGAPVVEGIPTAAALIARATGVDLPICTAVADLIAGAITLPDAIARLLTRKLRDEAP
jgi:glycerol-3-phosphate dehydrogenase (NAD(P)+)